MAQLFSRNADAWFRLALAILGGGLVVLFLALAGLVRSDWSTGKGTAPEQPVPFSHKHHAGDLGIDCRYCHDTVETAAVAGFPPTETCMTCHSQIWTQASELSAVRGSLAIGEPIAWVRVHDLPDFVYFNHAIHIKRGIDCAQCHGKVEEMQRVRQDVSLSMSWCVSCHRKEAARLRSTMLGREVDVDAGEIERIGAWLPADHGALPPRLDDCYVCHR